MQDNHAQIIIKSLPRSSDRLPLFIVGDVHGCARELADLIELAKKYISEFQILLVGDLFTKGPDPVGVFELIQEYSALAIKGNHDWALWSIIQQSIKKSFLPVAEHSRQTLHMIRYHKRAILDFITSLPHAYTSLVEIQGQKVSWEKEYPLIVVHAGIDPTKGLYETSERMLLTARYVRWDNRGEEPKLALLPSAYRAEMLNPVANSQIANQHGEKEKFRWHELHMGPELVVFGHDAKQGLFRKTLPSGRPICVGTDTGCTYGNSLTGYFPEIDLAIQVRSHRKYFDIRKNLILTKTKSSHNHDI